MKIKKTLFSVISAVLCTAMLLGISAFAAEKRNIWQETKALTSAKYYSEYIRLVEKYSAKDSKNSVSFGKSLTKKYYEGQLEEIDDDDPEFYVNLIGSNEIVSVVFKDGKMKMVTYADGDGAAIYVTKKNMIILSVNEKAKITIPVSNDSYDETFKEELETFDNDEYMDEELGVTDKTKGKYFKIKSGDKTYYYEEFNGNVQGKFGFLFNSKGKPIAMYSDGTAYCLNYSYTKVDDSEFKLPSGYEEV